MSLGARALSEAISLYLARKSNNKSRDRPARCCIRAGSDQYLTSSHRTNAGAFHAPALVGVVQTTVWQLSAPGAALFHGVIDGADGRRAVGDLSSPSTSPTCTATLRRAPRRIGITKRYGLPTPAFAHSPPLMEKAGCLSFGRYGLLQRLFSGLETLGSGRFTMAWIFSIRARAR